ncbi:IclR family transcriptional regulator [Terribacillus sp. 7520-G]|uniref:IclR family transcriptional regulator n=1 Tax=Terribacillus TaxID=459532 RepID=UPI000BA7597D|nr:IclR family transcriptional regulator [Terribacillus sp. 7520-G]PAD37642.1 IclR family transcriptional regulator [Terribacillus sp. 7520-G]
MSNVQSLERALTILNTLSDHPDGLPIAKLTKLVDLSKSTTHRLLATLVDMNYVAKDPESDNYKVGLQTLYVARSVLNNNNIVNIAKPYLKQLCADVNETVHLCIEDKGEIVYIDKLESNQTIRMYSRIGNRAPMYCTAVGKILLSGMPESRLAEIADSIAFIPRTPRTIASKEELYTEVDRVRQQGYALDDIENEEGIRCIAAPIYSHEHRIVASFSISGPSNRVTTDRVNAELIQKVRACSEEISRALGYTG